MDVDGLAYGGQVRSCFVFSMTLGPEVGLQQSRALRSTRFLALCYHGSTSTHQRPAFDRRSRRYEAW